MKLLLASLIAIALVVCTVSADTLIVYPSADLNGNGRVSRGTTVNETFSSIRSNAGTSGVNSPGNVDYLFGLLASSTTDRFDNQHRIIFIIDTSAIPDDSTVTSGKLSMYGVASANFVNDLGTPTYSLVWINPTTIGTDIAASDYALSRWDMGVTQSDEFSWSSWATNQYNNITISNMSSVNKTGMTYYGFVSSWDKAGSFTGTWGSGKYTYIVTRLSAYSGTSYDPFYTFEYNAGGDTTPPDSLTNFANTTNCSQSNITWTLPTSTDFNHTYTLWQNSWIGNLSNSTTFLLKTGLAESTTYTLSTKTVDLTGNMNATWYNYSVTTSACGVAPVANFSANDTEVCTVEAVAFTDTSTNTPTSWNWSFGDGNVSSEQNPVKTWNTTGLKTINLTVSNAYGSDSEVKTNYINVTACTVPTPTPTTPPPTTPPPTTTPVPTGCVFTNISVTNVSANSSSWSITSGSLSFGVNIIDSTNVSYYRCGGTVIDSGGGGGGGITSGSSPLSILGIGIGLFAVFVAAYRK